MKFVVRVWGSGVICLLLGQGSIATFSYAAVDLSAHAVKVEAVLSNLTLEQKVAQMIQAEIKYVTPDDIRHYGLGSVLNGGGSFPRGDKHATTEEWVSLADDFYYASIDRSEGNAGIPLIWGTDAVHGHNNVIGATLFPHNIGLGAARDPDLIYRIGVATAREVAATGIDWIFAPTVAVATDYRWGRTYEVTVAIINWLLITPSKLYGLCKAREQSQPRSILSEMAVLIEALIKATPASG